MVHHIVGLGGGGRRGGEERRGEERGGEERRERVSRTASDDSCGEGLGMRLISSKDLP